MLQAVDPAVAQAVADSGQDVTSLTRQGEELLLSATPLKAKPGWALVVQQEAREARQAWADKLRTLGLASPWGWWPSAWAPSGPCASSCGAWNGSTRKRTSSTTR
jgi:hypothetical protein